MNFVNELAGHDDILRVECISQRGIFKRSDAFLFIVNSSVVLLDSGLAEVTYTLARLLELRAKWLVGREEFFEDKNAKLNITWIASHMHIDHVGAFMDGIARCPYIYVEKAYLPPKTVFFDPVLSPFGEGDFKYRDRLSTIFEEYQSWCEIVNIPFSETQTCSFKKDNATFTLIPPTVDWGGSEFETKCTDLYAPNRSQSLPVAIGNANSMWLLVEYAGKRFLFTGDSIKKYADRSDENLDLMLTNWKNFIGNIDVLKYPHHGMERDEAAHLVLAMKPKYIVFNAIDATCQKKMMELDPECAKTIEFVQTGFRDRVFTVNKDGNLNLDGNEV